MAINLGNEKARGIAKTLALMGETFDIFSRAQREQQSNKLREFQVLQELGRQKRTEAYREGQIARQETATKLRAAERGEDIARELTQTGVVNARADRRELRDINKTALGTIDKIIDDARLGVTTANNLLKPAVNLYTSAMDGLTGMFSTTIESGFGAIFNDLKMKTPVEGFYVAVSDLARRYGGNVPADYVDFASQLPPIYQDKMMQLTGTNLRIARGEYQKWAQGLKNVGTSYAKATEFMAGVESKLNEFNALTDRYGREREELAGLVGFEPPEPLVPVDDPLKLGEQSEVDVFFNEAWPGP